MKKTIKVMAVFLTMVLISGCSMNNKEVDGVDNAAAPNVMINNRLYHTTGELYDGRFFNEANENDRNQQYEVDGLITSTVEGYMLPEKNNQSNFNHLHYPPFSLTIITQIKEGVKYFYLTPSKLITILKPLIK